MLLRTRLLLSDFNVEDLHMERSVTAGHSSCASASRKPHSSAPHTHSVYFTHVCGVCAISHSVCVWMCYCVCPACVGTRLIYLRKQLLRTTYCESANTYTEQKRFVNILYSFTVLAPRSRLCLGQRGVCRRQTRGAEVRVSSSGLWAVRSGDGSVS